MFGYFGPQLKRQKKRNEGEGSNHCFRSFTPLAGRLQGNHIASGVCSGEYLAEIIYPEESDFDEEFLSPFFFSCYCCSIRQIVLRKSYVVEEMQCNHCIDRILSRVALLVINSRLSLTCIRTVIAYSLQ